MTHAGKRVLKNFGVVLRGRGIAALLTLTATALMAKALPAAEFGLVILLHTYVLAIRGILNFRTYEAIVRFGVPLHENGENAQLETLYRTTTLIDIASAMLAAAVGFAMAPVAASMLHWDQHMTSLAGLYSLVMLTTAINTPNGMLRLYDRFDALSTYYLVGPSIRLLGVLVAWPMHAPMQVFIGIWAAAFVTENTWLFLRGHIELARRQRRSLWSRWHWREALRTNREFRHFIAVCYWQTNVDLLPRHLSVLLAGSLLGPAAAGMFRLARDFSSILSKPAGMLRDVLFPDLARILHRQTGGFHALGRQAARAAIMTGLLLVLLSIPAAGPLLRLIGPEYTQASTLLSLMLLAATFELTTSPLRATAYAMGRVAPVLRIHILGLLVFLGLFYFAARWLGLTGPGIAAVAGSLLTLLLMLALTRKRRDGAEGPVSRGAGQRRR